MTEAKTRRYLPALVTAKQYIVPDKELKLPYRGWEAKANDVDEGSVTVIMFCKNVTELRQRKEAGQLI